MKWPQRCLPLLVGVLGLLLASGIALAALVDRSDQTPVYTVAELRAEWARTPSMWDGRSVLVRAAAVPCPWWGTLARRLHCAGRPLVLIGAPTDAPSDPLPLGPAAPQPLLAFLHSLPILRKVLPQRLPLFTVTRVRIRIRVLPARSCLSRLPCIEALPLDTVPGDW